MTIRHVLAVVPITDFDAARAWYERLFGTLPTNIPMPGQLVEWRVTDAGWVQVTKDAANAGSTMLNFAVDDLERHLQELRARGLSPGEIQDVNKGVQLSTLSDPDGNAITFIGSFREKY